MTLYLVSTPPKEADKTEVQYIARLKKLLVYVDAAHSLDKLIKYSITGV